MFLYGFLILTFFFLPLTFFRYTEIKDGYCDDVTGRIAVRTVAACEEGLKLLGISYNSLETTTNAIFEGGTNEISGGGGALPPAGCLVKYTDLSKINDVIVHENSETVQKKCSSAVNERSCVCWSGNACEKFAGKLPNEVSCSCGSSICNYANPFCTRSSSFCSPTIQCKIIKVLFHDHFFFFGG